MILASGLLAMLQGWIVMLGLGVLHQDIPTVPAIGFWGTVAVTWAWGIIWMRLTYKENLADLHERSKR